MNVTQHQEEVADSRRLHSSEGRGIGARQWLGAGLLLAVILVVLAVTMWPDEPKPNPADRAGLTVVKGYLGPLKVDLINNPQVEKILAERYGLRVEATQVPSIEMVCNMPLDGIDFLWPGDQLALAMYRERGGTAVRTDSIFNSPIVLYSWAPIVDALVAMGLARAEQGGAYYSFDLVHFIDLVRQGKTWADIGLPDLNGRLRIRTSDPTQSNSGLLFAGLLANVLNGGEVTDATTVVPLLPTIASFFVGLMPTATIDLFEQFLTQGMGASPIIAAYESQIIEFILRNPSKRDQINREVRILYPRPTVWATHPLIARTEQGARLLQAVKDPEIQRLAWEQNGFRPGIAEVDVDPNVFQIAGIPPQITSVIDMPARRVMDQILAAIAAASGGATSETTVPAACSPVPTPVETPTG